MLTLPKAVEDCVVCCDASITGLVVVLIKQGSFIVHASWKLKPHEVRYHMHDLELGVVVFAFMIWKIYLYGVWCAIYPDQIP